MDSMLWEASCGRSASRSVSQQDAGVLRAASPGQRLPAGILQVASSGQCAPGIISQLEASVLRVAINEAPV